MSKIYTITAILAASMSASALASTEDFYRGRTISIICGFAPGGGYDHHARLLARHLPRMVPGTPAAVVQNMVGAGSIRAANYVAMSAPKDGTVIAAVNQNVALYQLVGGKSAQYDARNFYWLGSASNSVGILYTWHTSPVRTIEDAKHHVANMGSQGPNSDSHIYPALINKLVGTKFKIITGYTSGSAALELAIERGEIDGRGGNSYNSLMVSNPDWIRDKKVNVVVQVGLAPEPNLKGVPMLQSLVKDEADRQIVDLISLSTAIGNAHWISGDTPPDRAGTLRKAYESTLADSAYNEEAERLRLAIRATPGSELQAMVERVASYPKAQKDAAAELLGWRD
ncbi:MAG: Bug family tripartite tricarboxylate transporter substrate binding protein [Beijerinckiaceae bacterium]